MFLMTKISLFSFYIPKFVFVNHHFNFLGLQRSVKIVVVQSSTILTAFVLLIVSRDLVLLRYVFFSFDSFPDRRQVVYTVETLEFQKFSQNS